MSVLSTETETLNYFTWNIISPHVNVIQKSQEQEKCIPFIETTIYLPNADNVRILFKNQQTKRIIFICMCMKE